MAKMASFTDEQMMKAERALRSLQDKKPPTTPADKALLQLSPIIVAAHAKGYSLQEIQTIIQQVTGAKIGLALVKDAAKGKLEAIA